MEKREALRVVIGVNYGGDWSERDERVGTRTEGVLVKSNRSVPFR
jgi:hypothetical protein